MSTGSRALLTSALVAALLAPAACAGSGKGGGAGGADGDGGGGSGSGGGSGADAAPRTGACAPDATLPENDTAYIIRSGGIDRTYFLHLPAGYDRSPTPLIVNFHGFSSFDTQQRDFTGMNDTADQDGFAVVYPQGTGAPAGWNAGACCGTAVTAGIDDVTFTADLLDAVEQQLCVDPRRVYATGFSNGGFLSHRLACEMSDRIAAVAPVSGVMGIDTCEPGRPMPVIDMHGTADAVVPYGGSAALGFVSVATTMNGWADRDGCTGDPVTTFQQGDATCQAWQTCEGGAEVELCTIDGGGHTWPGGTVPVVLGKTSRDLIANDQMWDFFTRHPLP